MNPLTPIDCDLRSYTWLKLDYSRLFASEFFAMANDAEFRCAFILWCKAMQQLPAGSLPDNDKVLAGWTGKTLKQWSKIKPVAMHGWQLADDGRLYHAVVAEVVNDVIGNKQPSSTPNQPSTPKSAKPRKTSAQRMADKRQRDAGLSSQQQQSDAHVTRENVTCDANVTRSDASVTKEAVKCDTKSVTFEGGKGGDLDLELQRDLELKQEINSLSKTREAEKKSSRFFDDELRPSVHALNSKLGANLVTEEFITQNLFAFNAHYETQCLTENQRLAKWISWFRSEQAKATVKPESIQRAKKQTFGNVNEAFPIGNHRLLTPEEQAAARQALENDPNVIF